MLAMKRIICLLLTLALLLTGCGKKEVPPPESPAVRTVPARNQGPEYLLVDGYNIIFAWDALKKMAQSSLEGARHLLMDLLCNYQGFKKCVVILVFDA